MNRCRPAWWPFLGGCCFTGGSGDPLPPRGQVSSPPRILAPYWPLGPETGTLTHVSDDELYPPHGGRRVGTLRPPPQPLAWIALPPSPVIRDDGLLFPFLVLWASFDECSRTLLGNRDSAPSTQRLFGPHTSEVEGVQGAWELSGNPLCTRSTLIPPRF